MNYAGALTEGVFSGSRKLLQHSALIILSGQQIHYWLFRWKSFFGFSKSTVHQWTFYFMPDCYTVYCIYMTYTSEDRVGYTLEANHPYNMFCRSSSSPQQIQHHAAKERISFICCEYHLLPLVMRLCEEGGWQTLPSEWLETVVQSGLEWIIIFCLLVTCWFWPNLHPLMAGMVRWASLASSNCEWVPKQFHRIS